jgi:tape measure domain-containing protein
MPNFDINVVVKDGKAITQIRQVRGELDKTAKKATAVRASFRGLFAGFGIAIAVREFINLSNATVAIENRLKIVSNSTEEVNDSFEKLAKISRLTRSPLEENVALFQRAKQAQQELGASNADLFKFVQATGTALAIQGGAANTARGALIQLSQSIGATIVRAEEFNSILEGALPLAQAAARGIDRAGGSVSKLRQLVITGQISSAEFFRAIVSQSEFLESQFSKANSTIAQAFTAFRNSAIEAFRVFDKGTSVTTTLANTILFLADNMQTLARIIVGGAVFFAITRGATLALGAIQALVVGVRIASLALVTNPIGAIFIAIGLAVAATIAVVSSFGDKIADLSPTAAAAIRIIVDSFKKLKDFTLGVVKSIATAFSNLFGPGGVTSGLDGFIRDFARTLDKIPAFFKAVKAGVEEIMKDLWGSLREIALRGLASILRELGKPLLTISGGGSGTLLGKFFGVKEFEKEVIGGIQLFSDAADALERVANRGGTEVAKSIGDAYVAELARGPISGYLSLLVKAEAENARRLAREALLVPPAPDAGAGEGSDPLDLGKGGSKTTFADIVKEYENGIKVLGLLGEEQRVFNSLMEAADKIGRDLTANETTQLELLIKKKAILEEASSVYDELNGRVDDYILRQQAVNNLLERGAIGGNEAQLALAQTQLAQDLGDTDRSIGGQFDFQAQLDEVRNYTIERELILQQARDVNLINEEEYQARLKELVQTNQREILDLELARWQGAVSNAQNSIGILLGAAEKYAGKESGIYKGLFVAQQALAVAQATINTFTAVSNALALPFPPPIPQSLAAAAAVAGGAQVAGILATTAAGLKDGGRIRGPGGPRDDAAGLFALSNGEFVVNSDAAQANMPLLEAINRGMKIGAMQSGGLVASSTGLTNAGSNEVKTASRTQPQKLPDMNSNVQVPVNIINVNSQEEALAALGGGDGREVILNQLSENAPAVRNILGLEN